MKIYIFFVCVFFSFANLFSDAIYSSLDYNIKNHEAIKWNPEQGIFFSPQRVNLSSNNGKIYYLVSSDLSSSEPIEYSEDLFLRGEEGRIIDYNVVAMIEKNNGSIEFFSRTYRIDRMEKFKELPQEKIDDKINIKIENNSNRIDIEAYENDNLFLIESREREFCYRIPKEKTGKVKESLSGANGEKKIFFVNILTQKDGKILSEIKNRTIDLKKPEAPDFGNLFWGQIYKQEDWVKIKSKSKYDKIYYWYREKKKDELLFGPPKKDDISKWSYYEKPILLESKYGLEGTIGIAAFSVGKNGIYSDLSGPFYFKANGIENPFKQTFYDETNDLAVKKVTLNEIELDKNNSITVNYKGVLKFENFSEDASFYFTIDSKKVSGTSDLFPCDGEFTFKNEEKEICEFSIFLSEGLKIGDFILGNNDFILPKLKKYQSNNVDLSKDETLVFYMPQNRVRFAASEDFNEPLEVSSESKEFPGNIEVFAKTNEEKKIKIKFAAFDDKENKIGESDYYYFTIDKKNPSCEVEAEGIDFSMIHNEIQGLKLSVKEKKSKIFYRFDEKKEWIPYTEKIIFYPPLFGESEIKIFTMSKDEVGNRRYNSSPFVLKFDRRGLFVDTSKKFSGNGSELFPYNSIERAIFFAKEKRIKIIYIVSGQLNQSNPLQIESDIVIQPYNIENISQINMETKSIWKQNHNWFNIEKNGYLEIRNINFNLKSGNEFVNVNSNKFKIYNSNIICAAKEDFILFSAKEGKIGVGNIALNLTKSDGKFTFIDARESVCILRNISGKIVTKDAEFFRIKNGIEFKLENISLESETENNSIFLSSEKTTCNIDKFIYKQTGNFKNTTLFDIKLSALNLNSSDFALEGKNPFETKICEANNSVINFENSLIRCVNGFSTIGFNVTNGEIALSKSMIDINNVADYIYAFRMFNSKLNLNSSVARISNTSNSVVFMLNKSRFNGVNNSIFSSNVKEKSFSFWINSEGEINTVNSLYYFNKNGSSSKFLFINNDGFIVPNWYSNAISTGITLAENLNYSDNEATLKDFYEKNIFYDFTEDFDMGSKFFFVPQNDSPIFQGGLDNTKSPLPIPEKDFLGKNRNMGSVGIDIGAIQKSGN
ncbi:MAG TPA: hypothetical protein PLO89_00945 [Spirochaetota bacterium]|nr:hypothetical protein [Spirochaetota bacterium]